MVEPVLRLEGVTRSYNIGQPSAIEVLHAIDLHLDPGEFLALMGPSGSGKSTLLNIIGLLDRPTQGRVVLNDIDTSSLDEPALTRLRARTLGFIFQFHHLLPAFTALENVMLPAWGDDGVPSGRMRERAAAMLDAVGLSDRRTFKANDLSGGQQQRVAIARALVTDPTLIVADEPTGDLDRVTGAEVLDLLAELNRELGKTIVMVTHDPKAAARARRLIHLEKGELVPDDPLLTP